MSSSRVSSRAITLSAAEREVALLVAHGLSNAEIARARGVSPNTVANQIASLFRKLGVGSRLELTRKVAGRGG
ncbi:MAG: helix-turn-helix transcriptional regulator [Polyangiaceae bacterium]|nr:helix-turn-helix transcriptional regulator [Polyangiaceae bacterium]